MKKLGRSLIVLSMAGCGSGPTALGVRGVVIQTAAFAYGFMTDHQNPDAAIPGARFELDTPIRYNVLNESADDIYLKTHCEIVLERQTASGWKYVWGTDSCFSILERPTRLPPGGTFSAEVWPNQVTGSEPGMFRLRFLSVSASLVDEFTLGTLIPEERRASNVFSIE